MSESVADTIAACEVCGSTDPAVRIIIPDGAGERLFPDNPKMHTMACYWDEFHEPFAVAVAKAVSVAVYRGERNGYDGYDLIAAKAVLAFPRLRAALALLTAVEAEPRARRSSPGKGGHDRLLARLRAVIAEAEKP